MYFAIFGNRYFLLLFSFGNRNILIFTSLGNLCFTFLNLIGYFDCTQFLLFLNICLRFILRFALGFLT